ncbi:MAG: hypothetical protein WC224_07355 [Sphaerochaetaceae bacterium]
MSYQVYLLTVFYLCLSALVLLADEYGGKSHLLLWLKNSVSGSFYTHLCLIIVGVLLTSWKIFKPVAPGPLLLGDLLPVVGLLIMSVYYTVQLRHFKGEGKLKVVEQTSDYLERHKRNLGYFLLATAALHFLFPRAVLI